MPKWILDYSTEVGAVVMAVMAGVAAYIKSYETANVECDAKKHVMQYGCNIYYGHVHSVQEYSLVHRGDDSTLVGKSLGTLCRYDMPYMKGAPSNWQQAIAHFTVFPDGNYTEHTIRIFKHRFESQGILYDGQRQTVEKV